MFLLDALISNFTDPWMIGCDRERKIWEMVCML